MFRCILKFKKNFPRGNQPSSSSPLQQFTISISENFCEFFTIPTRLPSTLLELWV